MVPVESTVSVPEKPDANTITTPVTKPSGEWAAGKVATGVEAKGANGAPRVKQSCKETKPLPKDPPELWKFPTVLEMALKKLGVISRVFAVKRPLTVRFVMTAFLQTAKLVKEWSD